MPEMTAMPTLPSAAPPASSSSASSGLAARTDKTAGSSQAVDAASSRTDAGADPNDKSFASVLQRQMQQAKPAPSPNTAGVIDANGKALPDVTGGIDAKARTMLDIAALLDANGKTLPDVAGAIDAKVTALPDVAALVDANGKALPDVAALVDANGKTLPDTAEVIDAKATALAEGAALTAVPKEAGLSSKSADEASQEKSDDSQAQLSPYLLSLAANPSIKLEANSPSLSGTEKKAATAPEDGPPLVLTTPLPVQPQFSDAKDSSSPKLAETSQTAANKTAEFAAGLASSVEVAPSQTKPSESSAPETGFENLLAAAQAVNQGRGVHAPSHAGPSLPVQTPVGAHGWDGEVSDKLVWMVGRQEQRAELVLNPPQLGRVEVSLSISGGQTTALFVSANPMVRDALEAALPRLREILADAGVNLGQAQVGADAGSNQTANQSTNHSENWDNSGRSANKFDLANGLDQLHPVETTRWLRQADSLVDVFA